MKSIKELKQLPLENNFSYIDKSTEDKYNYTMSFGDFLISDIEIPKNKTTLNEYLNLLKLYIIDNMYSDYYYSLYEKYNHLFNDFKNEDGLYSVYAAFEMLLKSEEVSKEEKEILFEYKKLGYEIEKIEVQINLDDVDDFFINDQLFHINNYLKDMINFYENIENEKVQDIIEKGNHSIRVLNKMKEVYDGRDLHEVEAKIFYHK